MVLEVFKEKDNMEKRVKFNFMKVDVYSFGIMCVEILIGEKVFGDMGYMELKKKVKVNDNLKLRLDFLKEVYFLWL